MDGLLDHGFAGACGKMHRPARDAWIGRRLIPKRDESGSLRFGQARAALEHFQGLMRQHLRALV
jgi:hypothetical protein